MSTRGKCCVVEAMCEAPANGPGGVATKCFACGEHVCRKCSLHRPWHRYGRKRICRNCHEEDLRFRVMSEERKRNPPPQRQSVLDRRSDDTFRNSKRCPHCNGTGRVFNPKRIPA